MEMLHRIIMNDHESKDENKKQTQFNVFIQFNIAIFVFISKNVWSYILLEDQKILCSCSIFLKANGSNIVPFDSTEIDF